MVYLFYTKFLFFVTLFFKFGLKNPQAILYTEYKTVQPNAVAVPRPDRDLKDWDRAESGEKIGIFFAEVPVCPLFLETQNRNF